MIRAAGILFLVGDEALFLRRSDVGDHPGEWCFPGGKLEEGETALDAAQREAKEEIGSLPEGVPQEWTRTIADDVDYTTFAQKAPDKIEPQLDEEHTAFIWAPIKDPPGPLHPGCQIALDRFKMDELDVAKAILEGKLTSPQLYQNVWLFAMRITGTGLAYRTGKKEYVWREESLYLNERFLARCNGLPVIWEHPEKRSTLDSDEYNERVVGAIMLPYIQGNEVWGVAKIHDAAAAKLMAHQTFSTSPAVVLGGTDDTMLKTADGTPLLIEGKPSLLDHLAVCEQGVWDKGGDPVGVQSASTGDQTMTDETEDKKAREDAARKDAEAGQKLDNILEHLKTASSRMDSIEKRMDARKDAEEKEGEEFFEKAKADAAKRRDAEHEEWMKQDAAGCARDDADEESEVKRLEEEGEPTEIAADKARASRKDRMARRKDEAEKEEKEKMDAKERADSIKRAVDEALAKRLPAQESEEARAAKADAQSRADAVFQQFGNRAPAPMLGETTRDYRIRMARALQPHSAQWKGVELATLPGAALDIAEKQVYADAEAASRNPIDVPSGEMRTLHKVDPETGVRTTEFRGQHTYIKQMARPSRRVTGFVERRQG